MDMDFEINNTRTVKEYMFGNVQIRGSKALCDKIRELCENEFGKDNVS